AGENNDNSRPHCYAVHPLLDHEAQHRQRDLRGHDTDRVSRRNHKGETMTRSTTNPVPGKTEQVAGNGLLHRRALLRRGAAFAGALSTGAGLNATSAAAEPLAEPDWGLAPGDPVPAYQLPSKFAKNVVRTLSNPNFEPRTSQSRAPHQWLDGMIT